MVRRCSVASQTMVLAAALVLAVSQAAGALTIVSPVDGASVREKVRIAVPQSQVPSGGFISVNIDGEFRGAVGMPSSPGADVAYIWDTKVPIVNARGERSEPRDGRCEIEVVVHDGDSAPIASATVSVTVANKVPMTTPAPPVNLWYRYRVGDITKYRVKVRGELLDSTGRDIMGGQPAFTSEYEIGQWIEDVRVDGSALVRYRLTGKPKVTLLGQPAALAEPGQEATAIPPSVYKIVDKYGRTLETNVFSRGLNHRVSDIMVPLPGQPVALGHTWQSSQHLKIEGLGELLRFAANYKLDSLEYESGTECARVTSKLAGANIRLNLLSGQFQSDNSGMAGTSDVFFAYRTGKVIKSRVVLEMNASVDASAIGNLANAAPSNYTGPIFGQGDGEADDAARARTGSPGAAGQHNPYGTGTYNPYGGRAGGGQTGTRTNVKLRITCTTELKK